MRFDEVVAANGAGRSALLRQTLADALGVPLVWASHGTRHGGRRPALLGRGSGTGLRRARRPRGPDPEACATSPIRAPMLA